MKRGLQFQSMGNGKDLWKKKFRGGDRQPPEVEVEDWPSDERQLATMVTAASQPVLKRIWDNTDDAAYDDAS